jgi:hypothetical protein
MNPEPAIAGDRAHCKHEFLLSPLRGSESFHSATPGLRPGLLNFPPADAGSLNASSLIEPDLVEYP